MVSPGPGWNHRMELIFPPGGGEACDVEVGACWVTEQQLAMGGPTDPIAHRESSIHWLRELANNSISINSNILFQLGGQ